MHHGPRGRRFLESCFNVLTVCLPDICLFVADRFYWTGHYKLWLSGVHHQDVSAFYLTYKRREDGTIVGGTSTERAGTMIFMALDMLASIAANTHQLHLYRHDAELFLWVAIWVCGAHEGGKGRQDALFKVWTQGDTRYCDDQKLGFLGSPNRDGGILWSKGHHAKVDLGEICFHLYSDDFHRNSQKRQKLAIQAAGGVAEPEVAEPPETDYNRIDSKLCRILVFRPDRASALRTTAVHLAGGSCVYRTRSLLFVHLTCL